jgi:hypothetical protein
MNVTLSPATHFVTICDSPWKETRPMDVLNKVNVLAVCAAFVFVGAIVIGAF